MNGKENPVELLVICVVMVLLGILGVIAGFSRDLFGGLDGLLMLFVALMMVLIFSVLLVVEVKEQGWIGEHTKDGGPSATPAAGK